MNPVIICSQFVGFTQSNPVCTFGQLISLTLLPNILQKVNVPLARSKIPAIILKGTQLTTEDLEALEVVFKYCQTYHLSFENTNLTDKVRYFFNYCAVSLSSNRIT